MPKYRIVGSGFRTYGLRNEETYQIEQEGFRTKKMLKEFWDLHYSNKKDNKLIGYENENSS